MITEITVSYEATQSLEGYCDVRPGIRITARVDDGQDPQEVKLYLFNEARHIVHDEVDAALIRDGQPPRYYIGPRYSVGYNRETHQVAIVPDEKTGDLWDMDFVSHPVIRPARKMSPDQAMDVAERLADYIGDKAENIYTIVDCSDGCLGRLATQAPQMRHDGPGDSGSNQEIPF